MTAAALATQRFGDREWDAALRATGVVGIIAIPVILLVPGVEALVLLVLAVLWLRSPAAAFSMIGLEPLLMLYGRLYPVWLVVLVATAASVVVEVISLHVMRGVMALRLLERVRGHVRGSKIWIPVALGSVLILPSKLLLAVSVGSVSLGAVAAVVHFLIVGAAPVAARKA